MTCVFEPMNTLVPHFDIHAISIHMVVSSVLVFVFVFLLPFFYNFDLLLGANDAFSNVASYNAVYDRVENTTSSC